jgi:Na+-transporting methylmalonyl-CoA/oxaloacetate decarboxylase gamma subunit
MALRKVFSVLATILMGFAIVVFFACPIIVQVIFHEGFLHIDSMLLGASQFFIDQFIYMSRGEVLPIASVSSLAVLVIILILWIVFSIIKRHKSAAAFIFGTINIAIEYFLLMIFVFDTTDVIYQGAVEYTKGGKPLLFAILPGSTDFHMIFSYGMLTAFGVASIAFIFVLIAFLGDVLSKKAKQPKKPLTPEEKAAKKAAQKAADDERLRQIIREELSRHNDKVSEEQLTAAVASTPAKEQPKVEEAKQPEPVKEEAKTEINEQTEEVKVVDDEVAKEVEAEKPIEEQPAPTLENNEPQFNKLDPIERIFAEIESNRPELENPLPKKGEAVTPKLEEAKKEEPKEMTIEEKMEAGIKDAPVEKPQEEKEEEDDIERLEDEHLD